MTLDEEGNIISGDTNKNEKLLLELSEEMNVMKEKSKTHQVEINDLKENTGPGKLAGAVTNVT
jgi:hypothetical protein